MNKRQRKKAAVRNGWILTPRREIARLRNIRKCRDNTLTANKRNSAFERACKGLAWRDESMLIAPRVRITRSQLLEAEREDLFIYGWDLVDVYVNSRTWEDIHATAR